MGSPIAHSKSPAIHAAFAEQTGQQMAYQAVLVPAGGFREALAALYEQGCKGANVTLPFKHEAWLACSERTDRADRAGAVNTVWFDEQGHILGDNTDGVGFIRDLTHNLGCTLAGRDILVLGAGGAVRGIIDPLFDAGIESVVIANRTVDRAEAIAAAFSDRGSIRASTYADLAGQRFSVIINGTSLSLQNALPPLPEDILEPCGLAYDMMYSNKPTIFMQWAQARGAGRAADGLGMLVEQAAESFYIWRGVRPQTGPVIEKLRAGD